MFVKVGLRAYFRLKMKKDIYWCITKHIIENYYNDWQRIKETRQNFD